MTDILYLAKGNGFYFLGYSKNSNGKTNNLRPSRLQKDGLGLIDFFEPGISIEAVRALLSALTRRFRLQINTPNKVGNTYLNGFNAESIYMMVKDNFNKDFVRGLIGQSKDMTPRKYFNCFLEGSEIFCHYFIADENLRRLKCQFNKAQFTFNAIPKLTLAEYNELKPKELWNTILDPLLKQETAQAKADCNDLVKFAFVVNKVSQLTKLTTKQIHIYNRIYGTGRNETVIKLLDKEIISSLDSADELRKQHLKLLKAGSSLSFEEFIALCRKVSLKTPRKKITIDVVGDVFRDLMEKLTQDKDPSTIDYGWYDETTEDELNQNIQLLTEKNFAHSVRNQTIDNKVWQVLEVRGQHWKAVSQLLAPEIWKTKDTALDVV